MKFIAPLEIASKIMTLIVEAEKELILVSPYVKINDWDKMKKSLSKAVNKDVTITFIARKNANNDLSPLKAININPILIEDLHAKVYINDKYAIVTSQNITQYSDINSIDVGYQTEDEKERLELVDFVNNYINIKKKDKNKTTQIDRVERFDYENIEQLNSWQLKKVSTFLGSKYWSVKFITTSDYIFSSYLLPFCDVMISSVYTIKLHKEHPNCEKIIDAISKLNFAFKHTFKVELKTSHKTYYYLDFMPTSKIIINDFILDFENITDTILNSNDIKSIMNW